MIEMDDNNETDEKHIYKNALRRIIELDTKMHDSILRYGNTMSSESDKYLTEAIKIARVAIAEGAMQYIKKYE